MQQRKDTPKRKPRKHWTPTQTAAFVVACAELLRGLAALIDALR